MPKLTSLDDLRRLREQVEREIHTRTDTGTTITVGMGTCGIAAGARETMQAILRELAERDINANVRTVGCIGMCHREPLVDIEQAGHPGLPMAISRRTAWPALSRSICRRAPSSRSGW